MVKEGSILLGIGGDNSNWGFGTFFEGCITTGYPSDAVDGLIHANVVEAGYGKSTVPARFDCDRSTSPRQFRVRYNPSTSAAAISYAVEHAARVSICVIDPHGRLAAVVVNGTVPQGRHESVWNTKRVRPGAYVCRVSIDGQDREAEKIIVER